jgi:site-specific recombinase XerD
MQVKKFAEHTRKSPEEVTAEQIRSYLLTLIDEGLSRSTVQQGYYGIAFFCKHVLNKPELISAIPRMKKHRPSVARCLEPEEISAIFNAVKNRKSRVILMLIYSAGLRVSEVVRIHVKDIESKHNRIYIRESKNNKDRYTVLSRKVLIELREYWKVHRPKTYLFPSYRTDGPISAASIQSVFKKAAKTAGIKKQVSVHILRHSFATHLLNNGADLYTVSQLLGHASIKTTTIYLHMTTRTFKTVVSPLDM